tara:strand:+ start:594 stop:770 length:177 start_codon:yes stop_codon:yes gene_type:complete
MSKPINLNQFRKSKVKVEKRALASSNSIKFSRTKIEKKIDGKENETLQKHLNNHKHTR